MNEAFGDFSVCFDLSNSTKAANGVVNFSPPSNNRIFECFDFDDKVFYIFGTFFSSESISQILLNKESLDFDIYDKICGNFLIVLYKKNTASLEFMIDPLGLLSTYYYVNKKKFILSTSSFYVKEKISDISIDYDVCSSFVVSGVNYFDNTFFKGIEKVKSEVFYRVDLSVGDLVIHESIVRETDRNISNDEIFEKVNFSLDSSLSQIFDKYNIPILDLTGGYDSRLLLTYAFGKGDFSCLTVGCGTADSRIAKKLCSFVEKMHSCFDPQLGDINSFDELTEMALKLSCGEMGIAEVVSPMLVQMWNSGRGGVSINGTGGELLRGRWLEGEKGGIVTGRLLNPSAIVKRLIPYGCNYDPFIYGLKQKTDTLLLRLVEDIQIRHDHLLNTQIIDMIYLSLRVRRWAGRYISNTNKLMPVVSPLLFDDIVLLSLITSPERKKNDKLVKDLLQNKNIEIANCLLDRGYPACNMNYYNMYKWLPSIWVKSKYYCNRLVGSSGGGDIAVEYMKGLFDCGLVDDTLDFDGMLSSFLYDRKGLVGFVKKCRGGLDCSMAYQLSRMVTLELSLRI